MGWMEKSKKADVKIAAVKAARTAVPDTALLDRPVSPEKPTTLMFASTFPLIRATIVQRRKHQVNPDVQGNFSGNRYEQEVKRQSPEGVGDCLEVNLT
jgi:hypothetical protein